ncbi:hypothetical protein [Desulfitibacter alkalitolerans]|uniref:hypothetical protein n=1 Tax=Desulfitibacter alkalitolerans TaxID=264641 RepID=UPI00047F522A|nr:hypothetical protein [Desulfitibacter alkalitolerans]
MRKIFICFIVALVFLVFAGCGSENTKQKEQDISSTTTETSKAAGPQDFSVSAAVDKSVELPEGYPTDKFPIYQGSYISWVIELDGGYTLAAFSKDEVKKVIDFYEKVLEGAKDTMDTRTEESLTSFGTKDGYTYNMDVGKSSEMEGYQTIITILLHPVK